MLARYTILFSKIQSFDASDLGFLAHVGGINVCLPSLFGRLKSYIANTRKTWTGRGRKRLKSILRVALLPKCKLLHVPVNAAGSTPVPVGMASCHKGGFAKNLKSDLDNSIPIMSAYNLYNTHACPPSSRIPRRPSKLTR